MNSSWSASGEAFATFWMLLVQVDVKKQSIYSKLTPMTEKLFFTLRVHIS